MNMSMNPALTFTLHHFKKEARHIRLRWALWMGIVLLDLALKLEWLLPMEDLESEEAMSLVMHLLTLGGAAVLALSACGEDLPGRDGAFIATRPLPRASYFLARALVVLVLLALPLMLQEGLYLIFSHRPLGAVLAGMLDAGLHHTAWLGWAVPAAALWRGWLQTLAGVAMLVAGWWLGLRLIGNIIIAVSGTEAAEAREERVLANGWLAALWAGLLLWCVLSWWRHRHEGTFQQILVRVAAASPLLAVVAVAWAHLASSPAGTDAAQVAELARSVSLTIPAENFRTVSGTEYQQRDARSFHGRIRTANLPPQIEVAPRLRQARVVQDGHTVPAYLTAGANDPREMLSRSPRFAPGPIAAALPPGTVLVPPNSTVPGEDPLEYPLGRVPAQSLDLNGGPMRLQCDFTADWYEWRKLADLPLEPGASTGSSLKQAEFIFVKAVPRYDAPAALTLVCRIHQEPPADLRGLQLVLHAPELHLAWCINTFAMFATRADHTSWERRLYQVHQVEVDGVPRMDPAKLRLIVMQRRHLGASPWTWESAPMDVRARSPGDREMLFPGGSVTPRGTETGALAQRLDSLQVPGPDAPRTELNRYVLDVLRAYRAISTNETRMQLGREIKTRLRPFAKEHLEVLLELPESVLDNNVSFPVYELARELVTEAHRDFIVDHMVESDWLADLARAKGWSAYARQRALPALMKLPRHDFYLRRLMLEWDDPALRQRQLRELRFDPDLATFEKLYEEPALRPRLEALARQLAAEIPPVLGWENEAGDALNIAVRQGSTAALDLGLHWAARGPAKGMSRVPHERVQMGEELAAATGLPKSEKDGLVPAGLDAAQFEYQPELRLWRKKP